MRTIPKYEEKCISSNGGHSEGAFLLRGRQPLRFRRLVGLLRSRSYRVLVDATQGYKELIAVQEETIRTLRATLKVHDEMREINKKERNPNRVTGGKSRGRPLGSKSKAVSFAADAMPDHDFVPFGARAEVAAALM
jgi:hypothetical protein